MISLLWVGILINIFRVCIPSFTSWAVKLFIPANASTIQATQTDLRTCRQQLSNLSIVDEFAKHARVSRKIASLQSQLEKEHKLYAEQCSKMKSNLSIFFNCLMALICIVIFFKFHHPVIQIPHKWMLPLSYFGQSSWSIGFTSWLTMSYLFVKNIHSAITGV